MRTREEQLRALGLCLCGYIARAAIALTDKGIYWPDEIYQSFEPAHRWVYGYGFVAWEFIDGARNWTFPGFVAAVLSICKLLGVNDPLVYTVTVKMLFALLAASIGYFIFLIAKQMQLSAKAAVLACGLFLMATPAMYFAPRAMSENASSFALIVGIWALGIFSHEKATVPRMLFGSSMLGLAVLFRLHSVIAVLFVLALLAFKNWRQLLPVIAVLSVWAFLYGLTDYLAWKDVPDAFMGGWFHSAYKYLKLSFVDKVAENWGTAPPGYFVKHLFTSMPVVFSTALLLTFLSIRKSWQPFLLFAFFVLIHSLSPHKELRFIVPALPYLFLAAAAGFERLPQTAFPFAYAGMAIFLIIENRLPLTFQMLGAYADRPNISAYKDSDAVNALLIEAGKKEDVCGLRVTTTHLAWTGGYTYFHKNVPMLMGNAGDARAANYAIVATGPAEIALQKIFEGPCTAIQFNPRLP